NPRTPTGLAPQASAFGHSATPALGDFLLKFMKFLVYATIYPATVEKSILHLKKIEKEKLLF
ncbi:MAG: hypothetical protein LM574_04505, partial [Archaeoglobus sp.]|nr:hypothetical protein [Archaeoglobus sp.]